MFGDKPHSAVIPARAAMLRAQATQVKNANKTQREWIFHVGDQVLLSEGHFKDSTQGNLAQADGSTKKLNAIYRGPFEIKEMISDVSYRLVLPSYMKGTHNAFHVSRLKPYLTTDAFPSRAARLAPPKPRMEGEEQHFEISEFCGHLTRAVSQRPVTTPTNREGWSTPTDTGAVHRFS
jgi:hypothetical protein